MRTWLKDLREAKNLTQSQIAKIIGISQQMYGFIENGKRCEPDKCDTEKAIAAVLGFDWTLFFPDEQEATDEPLTENGNADVCDRQQAL